MLCPFLLFRCRLAGQGDPDGPAPGSRRLCDSDALLKRLVPLSTIWAPQYLFKYLMTVKFQSYVCVLVVQRRSAFGECSCVRRRRYW